MANISDIIENFIMLTMGDEHEYVFNRGDLAERFDCVPSQINYVLGTRFTTERGYAILSRRGGGGSVTILKLVPDAMEVLARLTERGEVSANSAVQTIAMLVDSGHLTPDEGVIAASAVSDRAVGAWQDRDRIRLSILRNIIVTVLTERV